MYSGVKDQAFDFSAISKLHLSSSPSDHFQTIDTQGYNDLDLEEVFMLIDRTESAVGQQQLYYVLRNIPKDSTTIEKREALISYLESNPEGRKKIQENLQKLSHPNAHDMAGLINENFLPKPAWFWCIPLLSLAMLASIIATAYYPPMLLVVMALFIGNLIVHYWNKNNLNLYTNSIPQLLKLQRAAKVFYKDPFILKNNPTISEELSILSQIKKKSIFFTLESKLEGDTEYAAWAIVELFKVTFLLEPLFLFSILQYLKGNRKSIAKMLHFVGEIDLACSLRTLRKETSIWCTPNWISESIEMHNIYHPLIKNCTPNSLKLESNSLLLTGSNMSGKTTFIRTIGINLLCGMTLNMVFAERFSGVKMQVRTAIRIQDDIMNHKSYYFEEVLTIKKMVDASQNTVPCLFLLDELFKGTNTIERIAAGKAILTQLQSSNNLVFVSTHDIELTQLLQDKFMLFHFSEEVKNGKVVFDYQLKEGPLKKRNAIRILSLNGFPDSIVEDAYTTADQLEK